MPKYLITTCPHCKKEFEVKVQWVDNVIDDSDYKCTPDRVYSPKRATTPEPRYKKCPLCQGLINMDDPEEYNYRYEYKDDTPLNFKQRFQRWFRKF